MSGLGDFLAGAAIGTGDIAAKQIMLESQQKKEAALAQIRAKLDMERAKFVSGREDVRADRQITASDKRTALQIAADDKRADRAERGAWGRVSAQERMGLAAEDRADARAEAERKAKAPDTWVGEDGRVLRWNPDTEMAEEITEANPAGLEARREAKRGAEMGHHLSQIERAMETPVQKPIRTPLPRGTVGSAGSPGSTFTKDYNTATVLQQSYPTRFATVPDAMEFIKQLGSKNLKEIRLEVLDLVKDDYKFRNMTAPDQQKYIDQQVELIIGERSTAPAGGDGGGGDGGGGRPAPAGGDDGTPGVDPAAFGSGRDAAAIEELKELTKTWNQRNKSPDETEMVN